VSAKRARAASGKSGGRPRPDARGAATVIGTNAPRREGPDKVRGVARYIDDHVLPGVLHGATFRSSIACGRIRRLTLDPAFPWSEYVVARAADIPGENVVALIEHDQPLLAPERIRHPMEPILLVAHEDRARAYAALAHIHVEYDEETPVLDFESSATVFKSISIEKGDVAAALAAAPVVVEGEYRLPHQEQAYIETNGAAAWFEDDGTLVVMGSLQCPYYVQKALIPIFALPAEKVRVIQAVTGGGFGGKEEYPDILCAHAALLARKAGRPVKMIYDRAEDMAATTKRHPAVVRHRTGATRDGRIVAQDVEIVMDGGAYVTLSPVVLSRGTLHATGPYACENVRVRAKVVMTNTPPNGAFRGFGAPQTLFAAEMQMERLAEAVALSPIEVRRRNSVRPGSVLATGQVLGESVGALPALEACARKSGFERRTRACAQWNRNARRPTWRGVGIALVQHGSGFTGGGEAFLASRVAITLTRDGEIHVLAASTEIGQGTTTLFAQLTAEALGVPLELVSVDAPDTGRVPDSGPTVASRTCMMVGRILREAALEVKQALESVAGNMPATRPALREAARRLLGDAAERRFEAAYRKPEWIHWDDATHRGDAYEAYGFAALAVELEVDKATFEVTLRDVTVAADIGTVIHPLFAAGQVIGGVAQGLGWALLENVVFERGVMKNARFTDYTIPTSLDLPSIDVTFVSVPYTAGPFGAKGVGEMPMDIPAPAVAAAVRNALGLYFDELPITPERIAAALARRRAGAA
jgi:CO/xanthine dehydrogenase Mo-binding subunit